MIRRQAFSPYYNVVANVAQHTAYTKLFVAKNVVVPSILDPPKCGEEHKGPERSLQA
jgi:hypothetical protein